MSELSTRVRLRREELGLSQEQLAQRMGYRSKSSITKLEKGVNDIPQSKVEEFAAALETTPAWLMGLDNTAFVPPPGFEPLPRDVAEQVSIALKYEGYLEKERRQVEQFRRAEERLLPPDADYMQVEGLRIEARQKLCAQRPRSLGQASRISGVSPGDIAVLLVWLEKQSRGDCPAR